MVAALAAVVVIGIAIAVFASSDDTPTIAAGDPAGGTATTTGDPAAGTDPTGTLALDADSQAELERSIVGDDLAAFFGTLPPEEIESICLLWSADPEAVTEIWVSTYQTTFERQAGAGTALTEDELSEAVDAALADICA